MMCQNEDMLIEIDEKYLDEQIKKNLSRFIYREYKEEKGEYVYEFKHSKEDKKLLIIVDEEATIYYADSHSHYGFDKGDIDSLIEDVFDIFNDKLKILKVYSVKRWLGDFWVASTENVNSAEFLEEDMLPKEFFSEFKRLGGRIVETYWNKEAVTHKIKPFK